MRGGGDHVFFRSPVAEIDQLAAFAAKRHEGILKTDFFVADGAFHISAPLGPRFRAAHIDGNSASGSKRWIRGPEVKGPTERGWYAFRIAGEDPAIHR